MLLPSASKSDTGILRQPIGISEGEPVIEMLPIHLPSSAQTSWSPPTTAPPPHPPTHTHTHAKAHKKNKSEFQVTIQSIPSQSAIIGWRRMAVEQKSIGQQGWRRPNWCQLRLCRCCRNTGLLCRPLWQTTFNSLYRSRFISLPPLVFPSFCSGREAEDFSSFEIRYN